jgi:hypothetical protein
MRGESLPFLGEGQVADPVIEAGKRKATIFRMAWRRIGQESICNCAIPSRDNRSLSRQSLEATKWMELEGNVKEQLNIVQQDNLLAVSLHDVLQ